MIVLCGSSSVSTRLRRMTVCASRTISRSRSAGVSSFGEKRLEQVGGGTDHLIGGGGAALVAAGAVGDDDERGARELLARDDRDAILLLLPVADVLAGGRVD